MKDAEIRMTPKGRNIIKMYEEEAYGI